MTERKINRQIRGLSPAASFADNPEINPQTPPAVRVRAELTSLGILHLVFDFDDTLIGTRKVFYAACEDIVRILDPNANNQNPDISTMLEVIMALKPELQVNPAIMEVATLTVARLHGVNVNHPKVDQALVRARKIYCQDVPSVLPGAKEAVRTIFLAGFDPILVTHAQGGYTRHKLDVTSFSGMFAKVVSLSPDRAKAEQWQDCFSKLEIKPDEALVIGDNLTADILPPLGIGSKTVWVVNGSPFPPSEEDQQKFDQFAERAKRIDHTRELIETLLSW